jgi:TolA-binding protein
MKTAAQMLCMLYMLCAPGFAQAPAPVKPADSPAKIALPSSPAKDALYAAIHKRDQAEKQISELNLRLQQLQNQATQQYQQLQETDKLAGAALEAATTAAFKAANLDQSKYTLDLETMEFSARPEPKAEATPPTTKAADPAPPARR